MTPDDTLAPVGPTNEGAAPQTEAAPEQSNEHVEDTSDEAHEQALDVSGIEDVKAGRSIRDWLRFLDVRDDDVVDVQAFDSYAFGTKPSNISALVSGDRLRDPTFLVGLLEKGERGGSPPVGIFQVAGVLNPAVRARHVLNQWHVQGKGHETTDGDIVARRVLYIDVDAERVSGVSATAEEMARAHKAALRVLGLLRQAGIPERSLGFGHSGNGRAVYVALDRLDAAEALTRTIKEILAALSVLVDVPRALIDEKVCDPKRLMPLFGTIKRKGQNTPDRPHRRTAFVCHERIERVGSEALNRLLAYLLGHIPEEKKAASKVLKGYAKSDTQPKRGRGRPRKDGKPSPFEEANNLPPKDVAEWIGGLVGGEATCPGCSKCDAAKIGDHGLYCHRCAAKGVGPGKSTKGFWSNVDLVMEVRGVEATEAVNLLAEQFGFEGVRARRTRGSISGGSPAGHGSPDDPDDNRPVIVITAEQMDVNDQGISALAADAGIYQRSRCLVRVVGYRAPEASGKREPAVRRPEGTPVISILKAPTLSERLSLVARWVRIDGRSGDEIPAIPPAWAVGGISAREEWEGIRSITGVTEFPVMRPDGSILDTPGYDPETGLLHAPNAKFEPVPENPTREEALDTLELLKEPFADFPFAEPVHRTAAVAAVLTLFGREAYAGATPMVLIEANTRGTGKSLLAEVIGTIGTGRPLARTAHVKDEAETEKRITTIAMAGDRIMLIDNVRGSFGNATWENAVTAPTWKGRILGVSKDFEGPLAVLWLVTANNCEVAGDMPRRILSIKLLSNEERPEERTGFRHPDLLRWVRENRPRLVVAALTVLRAYVAAGRPAVDGARWGSFEGWAGLVASALIWLGEPDPCRSRDALEDAPESDLSKLRGLLSSWVTCLGDEPRRTAEVLALVARNAGRIEMLDEGADAGEEEGARTKDVKDDPPNEAGNDQTNHGEGDCPSTPGRDVSLDDFSPKWEVFRDAIVAFRPGKLGLPTPQQLGKALAHVRDRVVVVGDRRLTLRQSTERDNVCTWQVEAGQINAPAGEPQGMQGLEGKLPTHADPDLNSTIQDVGAEDTAGEKAGAHSIYDPTRLELETRVLSPASPAVSEPVENRDAPHQPPLGGEALGASAPPPGPSTPSSSSPQGTTPFRFATLQRETDAGEEEGEDDIEGFVDNYYFRQAMAAAERDLS